VQQGPVPLMEVLGDGERFGHDKDFVHAADARGGAPSPRRPRPHGPARRPWASAHSAPATIHTPTVPKIVRERAVVPPGLDLARRVAPRSSEHEREAPDVALAAGPPEREHQPAQRRPRAGAGGRNLAVDQRRERFPARGAHGR
jgi:hypothetical protein